MREIIIPKRTFMAITGWLARVVTRYEQYATRYTLNSCPIDVVIALPQKRSGKSNDALVDNTKGLSCFGIRDYLGNCCSYLPCTMLIKTSLLVKLTCSAFKLS